MIADGIEHINIQLKPDLDNYAVMGNPVSHSKSPLIHKTFAEQTNQNLYYQAIYVELDGFPATIKMFQELGGKGLNVTLPFKGEAFQCSSQLSERAQLAKAVNTLTFRNDGVIEGENTDGIGLVRDLANNGIQVSDRRILIVGAGGAARGILSPLLQLEPDAITVANRTPSKARDLVTNFKYASNLLACDLDALSSMDSFDLVINATSSGLSGELPSLPDSIFGPDSCSYDMVYGESEPVFVTWSRNHGARLALDGLGMLVEQAAESFYIWRGVRPETAPVIAMLRSNK